MTDEQKRVITSLKDQAQDKESLDNGDGDIFAYDACNLQKAADMIVELEETNASLRKENERIRQNSVSHETYKLAVDDLKSVCKITQDEMERVGRERDANEVQRDEYLKKYVSAEYDLRQLTQERDALECDRDALNAELIQARKERDAAVKIIRDARVYLEELGSPQYCLYQLMKWPCAENG